MYDIAVIGAGPAGSTFARLAGKKYRVLLAEKRRLIEAPGDSGSRKCCGGLLAPDAQRMLSELGLGLPKEILEDPQLFVVKAIDVRPGRERYYERHYINLDRQKFDRWLLSLLPGGVELRTGCRLDSYAFENGSFKLRLRQDGRVSTESARVLVGADGAASLVRTALPEKHPFPRKYFAIQEWLATERALPFFTSIFDPEITDYYCWTIPKNGCLVVGAALEPGAEAPLRFQLLKEKLKGLGFHLGQTRRREGAFVLRPTGLGQLCTGVRGIALIGEAAGFISPSSSEGFSFAFHSALALAEAMEASLAGFEARYARRTRPLKREIFLKNLKAPFIFGPRLRRAAMGSGFRSMRVRNP